LPLRHFIHPPQEERPVAGAMVVDLRLDLGRRRLHLLERLAPVALGFPLLVGQQLARRRCLVRLPRLDA